MINGIIFDLGHTLLHLTRPIDEVVREGIEGVANWFLKKKRIKLDSEGLVTAFLEERTIREAEAKETHVETLTIDWMKTALEKIEAPAKAQANVFLEAAVKMYYEAQQKAWQPYPDMLETVKHLKEQGYKLGLYSNASDDGLVQRLVNDNRLRSELSATLSSAHYGWRKPNPEGFQLIAKRWDIPPDKIVVIGDLLEADILGAHNAGMKSIWATMTERPENVAHSEIQPSATIKNLAEIPAIVKTL